MQLFEELKRRNVFRVAVAYLVISWLLLQVVDVVGPLLNLSDELGRYLLFLMAIGFIPAMGFSLVQTAIKTGRVNLPLPLVAFSASSHLKTKQ